MPWRQLTLAEGATPYSDEPAEVVSVTAATDCSCPMGRPNVRHPRLRGGANDCITEDTPETTRAHLMCPHIHPLRLGVARRLTPVLWPLVCRRCTGSGELSGSEARRDAFLVALARSMCLSGFHRPPGFQGRRLPGTRHRPDQRLERFRHPACLGVSSGPAPLCLPGAPGLLSHCCQVPWSTGASRL